MPDVQTTITPPRVPLTDPRTGLISREWYRFFLNLFNLTGSGTNTTTLVDLQLGPADQQQDTSQVDALGQALGSQPSDSALIEQIADLQNQVNALKSALQNDPGEIVELKKQIEEVKLLTRQELGTLAAVNQDNVPFFRFSAQPSPDPGNLVRVLRWNSDDDTLNIHHTGDVIQQVGEETYMRVTNNTGVTIPNGTAVRFSGVDAGDNFIEVTPLVADGTIPSLYVIGIATQDIVNGGYGRITVWGRVHDINTTGTPVSETWAVGDILYANPNNAGKLTNVKPTSPDICVPMAAVLDVDATIGQIFVRPTIEQFEAYGSFSDTTDQTIGAIYTPQAVKFNTTDIANRFSVVSSSRITSATSGLYDMEFSLQLESSSASSKQVFIWLRQNGTDIANSLGEITISGANTTLVPAWNFLCSMDAGDYIELMWAADSTNVFVSYKPSAAGADGTAAFARPATPSAVLTMSHVSQ